MINERQAEPRQWGQGSIVYLSTHQLDQALPVIINRSSRMNILFLSTIFPDTLNPARGTFNYELCLALQRAGANLRVIAPQPWTEVFGRKLSGKVSYATEGMVRHRLDVSYPTYWYPPKIARGAYGQFYWRSIAETVDRLLRDWQPDFILSYWAHPDGAAGLRLSERTGAPCAVIVGGSDVLLLPKSPSRKRQVVDVLTRSDAVLTVSQKLAEVVEDLGADPARVIPVYQGVDPHRFHVEDKLVARRWLGMDPNRPLLLWVGRMVPVKNLDMLIAAVEFKANRGDDFVLCLLGDGPERPRIAKLIADKGLEGIVSIVGAVSHEELPNWYQAADLTILCSHSEGLPNVLRESLACGTPFVSTNVGSISEIADSNYSMLVPAGDAPALAKAIDLVLYGPQQERAAHTHIRTWDNMATEVLEIADTLLHPPVMESDLLPDSEHQQEYEEEHESLPESAQTQPADMELRADSEDVEPTEEISPPEPGIEKVQE